MGTWRIEVTGTGMHHNGKSEDADAQGRALVAGLRAAGSTVRAATLTLTVMSSNGEVPSEDSEAVTDLLTSG